MRGRLLQDTTQSQRQSLLCVWHTKFVQEAVRKCPVCPRRGCPSVDEPSATPNSSFDGRRHTTHTSFFDNMEITREKKTPVTTDWQDSLRQGRFAILFFHFPKTGCLRVPRAPVKGTAHGCFMLPNGAERGQSLPLT